MHQKKEKKKLKSRTGMPSPILSTSGLESGLLCLRHLGLSSLPLPLLETGSLLGFWLVRGKSPGRGVHRLRPAKLFHTRCTALGRPLSLCGLQLTYLSKEQIAKKDLGCSFSLKPHESNLDRAVAGFSMKPQSG